MANPRIGMLYFNEIHVIQLLLKVDILTHCKFIVKPKPTRIWADLTHVGLSC